GDSAHEAHQFLPTGEFLTRWITHICAPTFVLLAGAALALSSERRRDEPGQTAFIVKRGLLIAALDPIWMSLGFPVHHKVIFQVLYAIGMSLVCMAFLRRLSSAWLLGGAVAIQLFGELSTRWQPTTQPAHALWVFLFAGGQPFRHAVVAYPLVPWLSMMMAGWVLGRWLVATRDRPPRSRVPILVAIGCGLLAVFALVRGLDGYGNWGLHRDSSSLLQWLHVAKYPPSLSYTTLELGLAFLLLALFCALDDGRPRRVLQPLAIFGSTAFFFYLLHVHIAGWAAALARLSPFDADPQQHGLLKTYVVTLFVLLLFLPICRWYRGYKSRHADGWTRYI
ncbi:MAG TPA: heparan-alpha-glucosaminide N-acetyltransferase domain-containing protein, partial [Polyangia bacterium]|nr:heparan-alpha-glucosaminide N-acetyltransferase domain-containing protein [Polyangia bacterium]